MVKILLEAIECCQGHKALTSWQWGSLSRGQGCTGKHIPVQGCLTLRLHTANWSIQERHIACDIFCLHADETLIAIRSLALVTGRMPVAMLDAAWSDTWRTHAISNAG